MLQCSIYDAFLQGISPNFSKVTSDPAEHFAQILKAVVNSNCKLLFLFELLPILFK
jgi:hypothetical protein